MSSWSSWRGVSRCRVAASRFGVEVSRPGLRPLLEERVLLLGAHDAVGWVGVLVKRAKVPKDTEPLGGPVGCAERGPEELLGQGYNV